MIKTSVFTRNSSSASLLLTHDDEFISVDLIKVFNILPTEPSEDLSMHVNMMGPLTRRAKLTVTLEIVQADVKLVAGGGELAGAVQTVAFVVMCTDLKECAEGGGDHIITIKIDRNVFFNHFFTQYQ